MVYVGRVIRLSLQFVNGRSDKTHRIYLIQIIVAGSCNKLIFVSSQDVNARPMPFNNVFDLLSHSQIDSSPKNKIGYDPIRLYQRSKHCIQCHGVVGACHTLLKGKPLVMTHRQKFDAGNCAWTVQRN
jgi:hypothetical protein